MNFQINRFLRVILIFAFLYSSIGFANSEDRSTWPSTEIAPMKIPTFPVDRNQISSKALEIYYEGRAKVDKFIQNPNSNKNDCLVTTKYLNNILGRLITSSNLNKYISEQKASLILGVECNQGFNGSTIFSAPASMTFGVLGVAGGFLKLLNTEDEIAFIMSHELAHYLLAHDILAWDWSEKDIGQIFLKKMLQERDADMLGLQLLTNAKYNPNSAIKAYTTMFDRFDSWGPDPTHFNHRYLVHNLDEQIKTFGYKSVVETHFPTDIMPKILEEISKAPLCGAWKAKIFGC